MSEQTPPWAKQGPASYFPSIEKKYGRSIRDRPLLGALEESDAGTTIRQV